MAIDDIFDQPSDGDLGAFQAALRQVFCDHGFAGLVIYAQPLTVGECTECQTPHPTFVDGRSGTAFLAPYPNSQDGHGRGYAAVEEIERLASNGSVADVLDAAHNEVIGHWPPEHN